MILDDGGEPLNAEQARDVWEVLDDRYQRAAAIVTSQVPVAQWHGLLADPTIADAVLDRVVHQAYRLDLGGNPCGKPCGRRHGDYNRSIAISGGLAANYWNTGWGITGLPGGLRRNAHHTTSARWVGPRSWSRPQVTCA